MVSASGLCGDLWPARVLGSDGPVRVKLGSGPQSDDRSCDRVCVCVCVCVCERESADALQGGRSGVSAGAHALGAKWIII